MLGSDQGCRYRSDGLFVSSQATEESYAAILPRSVFPHCEHMICIDTVSSGWLDHHRGFHSHG